jgi:hypothetical protein
MNNVTETDRNGNRIIQGLWVGDRLPIMQQLSIASFLAHGHDYHLYTYTRMDKVPEGTVLKDAREILPESAVFRNAARDTYAAFSDFFRYKLLLDKGGWWADLDMVCLRPFDFADDYVFSSEHELCLESTNSGVIKAPKGAQVIAFAWDTCQQKDKRNLTWTEVGPDLLGESVERFGLQRHVKPAITFCALLSDNWHFVVRPHHEFCFRPYTYAIHLWHEVWRYHGWNVDHDYAPGSLYEQLKSKYLFKRPVEGPHHPFRVL